MNSEAVRQRNARKRAKLRAKKRGEVFTHVFFDIEVLGCSVPVGELTGWTQDDWEDTGLQISRGVHRMLGRSCSCCDDYSNGRCVRFANWGPICTREPRRTYQCTYVLLSSEESTDALEESIAEVFNHPELCDTRIAVRASLILTSQGQQRSQEWLVTADEDLEVADVMAAYYTLSRLLNRQISSSSI